MPPSDFADLSFVTVRERQTVGVDLLTGYEILTKQTSPSVSWLKTAREDLVKLYTASNQPEKAKEFQAELSGA